MNRKSKKAVREPIVLRTPPKGGSPLQTAIHETAKAKGWWDDERRYKTSTELDPDKVAEKVPEKLALQHSELSEALECYRDSKCTEDLLTVTFGPDGKPEGFLIEMADDIIRAYDTAGALNGDLMRAIQLKMDYNRTRPYRHGGKRC